MKKILALCLSLQAGLCALYQGNPAEPQLIDEGFFIPQDSLFSIKVGYQGDVIFNRRLKAHNGSIDQFAMHLNQGVITLNAIDRAEAYVNIGTMDAKISHYPSSDHKLREYQAPDHWTIGGGLRILIAQWENTCLGFNAGYQFSTPHVTRITLNGASDPSQARMRYQEWQAGFGLSHTVDIFTPYLGVTYSDVNARLRHLSPGVYTPSHLRMGSRERFGMALGCSLSSGKKVDLNFEARLFDEQAVTAAGNIKF